MVNAIYTIELRRGVKVDLLFTPRLYMYKGEQGITFNYESNDMAAMISVYADLMYCAARSHWDLTHTGNAPFPYSRIDFHAFAADRKAFNACMIHAMQAISGKDLEELKADMAKNKEEEVKKK